MRVEAALLVIVVSGSAWSEQESLQPAESHDQVPSMELLEFLGTFQDRNGRWLDPLLLDAADKDKPQVSRGDSEKVEMPGDESANDDK